jgi:putative transposase
MSEKYKFRNPEGLYFTTCTIVHWIDLFTRKEFKQLIINSLKHCQREKGLIIHAWCLMPSHLHMIVSTKGETLPSLFRDFKKFTAKAIVVELDNINESRKEWIIRAFKKSGQDLKRISNYKVWQDGNQPKSIETNLFLNQKLDYIHQNPVEAELVDEAEHYLYSSARNYAGFKGLLDIEILE